MVTESKKALVNLGNTKTLLLPKFSWVRHCSLPRMNCSRTAMSMPRSSG